ncbi:aminodeoxychorismate lyase [Catellatospora chokoriensis]|uniref:Putative aminotransferase, class IV n=1 Tax=Catellatospora chokoriensis TaxID=310353 RepID=A0A8J3NR57_9ACTN|nr:putative aminotransferase, class IV [Catellatospora chokoriensis]
MIAGTRSIPAVVQPVLVVQGRGVVPADTPVLRADDLGVLRGDGVFETMHVRPDGHGGVQPWLVDEHLARMARSAARMELALPAESALRELAALACAQWPVAAEGALRLVCTRGAEATAATGGPVTCFATVNPIGAATLAARRDGITVTTISLGYPADARTSAPWLLGGVKSLSYAINMASQRWALAQGVDDALWVSADGYALEGPTSTLVWLSGDTLCTVPVETTGILPGTTARHLLDNAGDLGWTAAERMVTPAELAAADGVWLLSSVRGIAELRAIDGTATAPSEHTEKLRAYLGFTNLGC